MSSLFQRLNETGKIAIAPSVLSADFTRLAAEIGDVERAGADYIHIDVMDGNFVGNITFGPMIVDAISRLSGIPVITHLMINDPGRYIERFAEAGSDLISFHYEAVEEGHSDIIDRLHSLGIPAGLALNPDTPLSEVRHLLEHLDLLLCMTVFPGFGGQAFIPGVLDKIREAASTRDEKGLGYVIEVDGGVNGETAGVVREAGGQILVAGTAVFKTGDYTAAISSLRGEV